jgi:type VI secretion system secreted protein Hcp
MTETKPKSAGSLVRRPLLAAALVASAVVPAPALAAYDVFLKLDTLEGEATQKGHEKWIQVYSTSVAFDNATSQGNGSGAGAGRSTCGPFNALKGIDKASPPLLAAIMTGKRFAAGTVEFVKQGGDISGTFLKYELSNVILSSLDESYAGGNAALEERIAMNYGKLTMTYSQQNADGRFVSAATASVTCSNNNN